MSSAESEPLAAGHGRWPGLRHRTSAGATADSDRIGAASVAQADTGEADTTGSAPRVSSPLVAAIAAEDVAGLRRQTSSSSSLSPPTRRRRLRHHSHHNTSTTSLPQPMPRSTTEPASSAAASSNAAAAPAAPPAVPSIPTLHELREQRTVRRHQRQTAVVLAAAAVAVYLLGANLLPPLLLLVLAAGFWWMARQPLQALSATNPAIAHSVGGQQAADVAWANAVLARAFFAMGGDMATMLQELIDFYLVENKPDLFRELSTESLSLGTSPPRVSSVEYLPGHSSRDQLVLALNLVYHADAEWKILALCSKRLFNQKLRIKVDDLKVEGRLLVRINFSTSSPYISAVTCAFWQQPLIDVTIKTLKTDLTELPGISSWIERMLTKSINSFMLYPAFFRYSFAAEPDQDAETEMLGVHGEAVGFAMPLSVAPLGGARDVLFCTISLDDSEFGAVLLHSLSYQQLTVNLYAQPAASQPPAPLGSQTLDLAHVTGWVPPNTHRSAATARLTFPVATTSLTRLGLAVPEPAARANSADHADPGTVQVEAELLVCRTATLADLKCASTGADLKCGSPSADEAAAGSLDSPLESSSATLSTAPSTSDLRRSTSSLNALEGLVPLRGVVHLLVRGLTLRGKDLTPSSDWMAQAAAAGKKLFCDVRLGMRHLLRIELDSDASSRTAITCSSHPAVELLTLRMDRDAVLHVEVVAAPPRAARRSLKGSLLAGRDILGRSNLPLLSLLHSATGSGKMLEFTQDLLLTSSVDLHAEQNPESLAMAVPDHVEHEIQRDSQRLFAKAHAPQHSSLFDSHNRFTAEDLLASLDGGSELGHLRLLALCRHLYFRGIIEPTSSSPPARFGDSKDAQYRFAADRPTAERRRLRDRKLNRSPWTIQLCIAFKAAPDVSFPALPASAQQLHFRPYKHSTLGNAVVPASSDEAKTAQEGNPEMDTDLDGPSLEGIEALLQDEPSTPAAAAESALGESLATFIYLDHVSVAGVPEASERRADTQFVIKVYADTRHSSKSAATSSPARLSGQILSFGGLRNKIGIATCETLHFVLSEKHLLKDRVVGTAELHVPYAMRANPEKMHAITMVARGDFASKVADEAPMRVTFAIRPIATSSV